MFTMGRPLADILRRVPGSEQAEWHRIDEFPAVGRKRQNRRSTSISSRAVARAGPSNGPRPVIAHSTWPAHRWRGTRPSQDAGDPARRRVAQWYELAGVHPAAEQW